MSSPDFREAVSVPSELYRRLWTIARKRNRTVSELVEEALEIHFGEDAALARLRLIDCLARLEAGLGPWDELFEQVRRESRNFLGNDVESR